MTYIGDIKNYYGGLSVKEEGGKYWWAIEDHDGYTWDEIPKSLYEALIQYEEKRRES